MVAKTKWNKILYGTLISLFFSSTSYAGVNLAMNASAYEEGGIHYNFASANNVKYNHGKAVDVSIKEGIVVISKGRGVVHLTKRVGYDDTAKSNLLGWINKEDKVVIVTAKSQSYWADTVMMVREFLGQYGVKDIEETSLDDPYTNKDMHLVLMPSGQYFFVDIEAGPVGAVFYGGSVPI